MTNKMDVQRTRNDTAQKNLPQCGTQERCAMCECSKIDARVCLPCKHRFCHTCIEKVLPPGCPILTACPICNCDVDRHKAAQHRKHTQQPVYDHCAEKNLCYRTSPPPCDEYFCYNCFTEGSNKIRATEFCLDCDVSMCETHLKIHKNFIKKKKHNMLPVCQYKLVKRKFECRRCKIHPKHTLLFVCNKCDMIVCQVCVACCDCEKGGRHDALELDTVALEMASSINQAMKDVDCVRKSGEKAITDAHKAYQQKECELEKLKQGVCREIEAKITELNQIKDNMIGNICELIKRNKRATNTHKTKIQDQLCEAKITVTKASQLLCYSHNVDIATEARMVLAKLECVKITEFPCLDLEGFNLCCQEVAVSMPTLQQDAGTTTNFCPQTTIPDHRPEDACAPCSRPRSPCPPSTSANGKNPLALPLDTDLGPDPCNPQLPTRQRRQSLTRDDCHRPRSTDPSTTQAPNENEPLFSPALSFQTARTHSSGENSPRYFSADDRDPICDSESGSLCDDKASSDGCEDKDPSNHSFGFDSLLSPSGSNMAGEWSQSECISFAVCIESLSCEKLRSKPKMINDISWHLMVEVTQRNENGCCVDYLGVFLVAEKCSSSDPCWKREASARLMVVNQVDPSGTECKEISHVFCKSESDWGYSKFMKLSDVTDPTSGYCKKAQIIIEASIRMKSVC